MENQVSLKPLTKFHLQKMEHLINEKREHKIKRSGSHGKFLFPGEKGNYVIN